MSDDKRLNEVIRVQKRPSSFVLIDKGFLENADLSWKAKGILAYLLSKPDQWKVIVKDLINHATDGKASVYTGLNELRESGYYEKRPVRNEKGHFIHWESTVYESPDLPLTENREVDTTLVKSTPQPLPDYPEMDYPDMGYPDMENRERSNNYISNNNCTNNHVSQVSLDDMADEQDEDGTDDLMHKIDAYTELIKINISYNDLAQSRPYDMQLVDEFIAIIIDTVFTEGKTVKIDGENKPQVLVISTLMKLNYNHIEHAIDQFKSVCDRINKKKQYILTMLYNCKLEVDAHYTNLVKHNMWNQ